MRCFVFERMERVLYVVGLNERAGNPLAEALLQEPRVAYRAFHKGKPFSGISRDKKVMYVERVGCVAYSANTAEHLRKKAESRAQALTVLYADLEVI